MIAAPIIYVLVAIAIAVAFVMLGMQTPLGLPDPVIVLGAALLWPVWGFGLLTTIALAVVGAALRQAGRLLP